MILTAHQPVYLPWLGLFHKIALADQFVSFNQVQYQVYDWNNRNRVKISSGEQWLTVPIMRQRHMDKLLTDMQIDATKTWRRKHWKTISIAYRKAPFFNHYAPYLEDIFAKKWDYLVDLNENMLSLFLDFLGIKTPILKMQQ